MLSCKPKIAIEKDAEVNEKPNVIIVLVDDLGYQDVGFNGCTDIPTPNIDRIANNGVKFTDAYVSYAVCGPSRAGLITGRYQDRFGFGKNPLLAPNDPNMGLPLSEQTIAEYLSESDYESVAIGKWHLGAYPTLRPLKRGFDDFFGFLSGGHQYFPEKWVLNDLSEIKTQYDGYKTKLLRNDSRIVETEYLTDALSREAVAYIDNKKTNPFFMYLAYNAPHGPLQATEKYLNRFPEIEDIKRKTYAAMVSAVDDGVGAILKKLEEKGLTENTIIFFLSDNGGPEKRNASNNGYLRAGKGSMFEGGIRVPFALQWPAKIKGGITYENPIISLDIFATISENCTPNIETKKTLDGVNLLPFLTESVDGLPHNKLFWRNFEKHENAARIGNQKLVFAKDQFQLFDLKTDIGETTDLSSSNPEEFNQLNAAWNAWNTELMDPVFLGLLDGKEYDKTHPNRYKPKKIN